MTKTPQQLAKERKPIFDAFIEGKEVQFRSDAGREWKDTDHLACFFDPDFEWRVKPKKLECWVNWYDSGPVYGHKTKKSAKRNAGSDATRIAVHMVEVDD